jgi:hypothetical protein
MELFVKAKRSTCRLFAARLAVASVGIYAAAAHPFATCSESAADRVTVATSIASTPSIAVTPDMTLSKGD